jgi:hypothetical protein
MQRAEDRPLFLHDLYKGDLRVPTRLLEEGKDSEVKEIMGIVHTLGEERMRAIATYGSSSNTANFCGILAQVHLAYVRGWLRRRGIPQSGDRRAPPAAKVSGVTRVNSP